jgi:hypothetical protein
MVENQETGLCVSEWGIRDVVFIFFNNEKNRVGNEVGNPLEIESGRPAAQLPACQRGRGAAALHAASAWNHVELVQLLLERGGDVDDRGVWWRTLLPVQFSAIERHLEMGGAVTV